MMQQQQPASAPVPVPEPAGAGTGPLTVGIVAPPWIPVPPPAYGGTELVIDVLARGLAARGHRVVLFATGDSTCGQDRGVGTTDQVKLDWHYKQGCGNGIGSSLVELNHAVAAYDALGGCDVVHDHTMAGLFVSQVERSVPVVTTNHGPFDEPDLADLYRRAAPAVPLIAVSHHQAASAAPVRVPVAAVVHHGLDLDAYPYSPGGGGYVAVLGRMHPDKGIDRAIDVARLAGVDLKIAAKMREPVEQAYYDDFVKPRLGGGVEYLGEVDHAGKVELLGGAAALLNPVRWPEPFGLVNIEALACGTPVVGTDWGALPELVSDHETGYIARSNTALVEALANIDRIDRAACRQAAESRFSMDRMAADHETFYHQVISTWPPPPGAGPVANAAEQGTGTGR